MNMNPSELIYMLTTWVIPLLLCMIIHEVAHGYVAMKLGDMTAKRAGRLTLNPKEHIDLMGSIIVPGLLLLVQSPVLFGWAKPVPVDFNNLKKPKRDMGIVAFAGPFSNFILAILFLLLGKLFVTVIPFGTPAFYWLIENVRNGVVLSVAIGLFNLIPILPLDGGRVLASLLPAPYSYEYQKTERFGPLILMALIFILPMIGINVIGWILGIFYPLF